MILAILGVLLFACVGGHIAPSTFQFTNVVPHSGLGPGGWKVAQVLVMLGRISTAFPEAATCEVEVGVPEVNFNGLITDEFAQMSAAKAADEAARIVFRQRQPTVLLCEQFRMHMQRIMGDLSVGLIPGTRITSLKTLGVPRRMFP
ncbi:hypothetical protein ACN28S_44930 [Cystobacter fuscus]